MRKRKDLLSQMTPGSTWGAWAVIAVEFVPHRNRKEVKSQCECGTVRYHTPHVLVSGISTSCGCKTRTRGGFWGTLEYRSWRNMLSRCDNPDHNRYEHYGGRGITYDPRWADFLTFLEDMGTCPEGCCSLDRKDVNGNYCKDNCEWASQKTQQRNKRSNKRIVFQGREQTVAEWAEELDIDPFLIYDRLSRGWSAEKALTTPRKRKVWNSSGVSDSLAV